jgi:hypothetical protein
MKTRLTPASVFMYLILLLLPPGGFAQTTSATILGIVTDQSGAVVSGATITIRNVETGATRSITTDEEGRYRVSALPPGNYEVRIERQGFAVELRSGIELTVGREAVVDFQLKIGGLKEEIKVSAEAPLVETTNAALTGLVGERSIRELPLNGRDVFQLTTLQNGVINTAGITAKSIGGGSIDVGPGTTKIAVNGARITSNNFLLDGSSVNDAFNNTPGGVSGNFMGVDTLREFQILTNSYSSEYGGAGGAIVNAVTKSGTNDLHGTLFYFLRNSALDARNFFDPGDTPAFKRNQFGGSFGGPVKQNKTFLFGSYEGLREGLGVSRRFSVPTAATRARAVPSVQPYVNLYPLPNGEDLGNGTAFFIRSHNDETRDDFFTTRIDHQFSDHDSFFGRYSFDDSKADQAVEVLQDALTNGRNQYVTLGEDHIFSPRVLNTVRLGFNRSFINGDSPFVVDIPSALSFVPGRPLGTFFGISEIAPLGNNLFTPRFFAYNHFEITDQVSINRGSHSIKSGFSARRIQLNAISSQTLNGLYFYVGIPGLSTLDTFLLGLPAIFIAPQPGADFYRGIRQSVISSYAQDDWKLSRKLTINLGVRYEFFTTPTEAHGKIANLRSVTDATTTVGEPFFNNPSKKNFAPRVGFAYDPFGNGKTSIRGGYGIFDMLILPYQYRFEMANQPPFAGLAFVAGPPPFFFPAPFPNAFDVIATSQLPQPASVNTIDFNPKRSYMQQYNVSVQRELVPTFVVTVAYTGSRGVHLARKTSINQRTDFVFINGRKFFPELGPGVSPQSRLLNPNFGAIRLTTFDGSSNYNALQLRVEKRFSHGLDFQSSYTWSKAIDEASGTESEFANVPGGSRIQDPLDKRAERGRAAFDIRHNFILGATYELPKNNKFRGVTDKLLNGWEVSGILTARTGFPFNVILGFDRARDASPDNIAQRPDLVPGRTYESAVTGNPDHYIDPTAFDLPTAGTYGNSARNALEGPALATFDLGVFKNTMVRERLKVQFRAEAFNLFNRANFSTPDNLVIFTSENKDVPGNFGRITRTSTTSRQLQFGLKLIF